jgi:hypothetical protein
MKKLKNIYGISYRKQGSFYLVYRPDIKSQYIQYLKHIDIDSITPEIVLEDYTVFSTGRLFYSRVNNHGVGFMLYGAMFTYLGREYKIGLPFGTDVSNYYTPEMLYQMLNEHGSFNHKNATWKKHP